MSFKDKDITIACWSGKQLYIGAYDDKEVDTVLDANRCKFCNHDLDINCEHCDGTGFSGDFTVHWNDESDKDGCNVYEYINY